MIEIWKDIEGYEGLYQVSNMGRVKSLNNNFSRKEKILKCHKINGYLRIDLHKNGGSKNFKVHRLVAEAFLPNPDNKPHINHINTVRDDNRVWVNEDGSIDYEKSNLEWCTPKENMNNPLTKEKIEGYLINRIGKHHPLSEPVIQFTKDGYMIRKWNCMRDVLRCKAIKGGNNISACCRGKQKTSGGYVWKYYDTDTYLIGKLNNRLIDMGYKTKKGA